MNGRHEWRRSLRLEGLEGRELMSANSLGAWTAWRSAVASHSPAAFASHASTADSASNETRLAASLTSNGTSAGKAYFESETEHGATKQVLVVNVTGATASSTLNVTVDGTVIGTLTTDAKGAGHTVFSSNPKNSSATALPTGFTLNAGSTIGVGDSISGAFATKTHGSDDGKHDDGGSDSSENETRLKASLTNAGVAAGTAAYHAETDHGVTRQSLRLRVTGLAASTTLNITVDGTVIGTLTTDAHGNGRARFSSNRHDSRVIALPANFTLNAGSTIQVGDTVVGTFA